MRILIADDDFDTRVLLEKTLQKWGHEVLAVDNGRDAFDILKNDSISLVISDWMMPIMDGLQLCRKVRSYNFDRYIYIILLTAKNDKKELVSGMEGGADDFVVKPFNKGELNVRIRAGERILQLERDLDERNEKLSDAYSLIKKDLEAAATIQKSLLPRASTDIQGIKFDWTFLPCTYVAGDILSFYPVNEHFVGFYLLDVAGHGIPSAMLSVTLNKMLGHTSLNDSLIKRSLREPPYYEIVSPAKVMQLLNDRFQDEEDAMQYFTMVYGLIDIRSNLMKFSQGGHPSPILIKQGEAAKEVGTGGFPVGMLPSMEYDEIEIEFNEGDRLFLYSDGITECMNSADEQFTGERLLHYLSKYRNLPLKELLENLKTHLCDWRGGDEFQDDVSILAIEKSDHNN